MQMKSRLTPNDIKPELCTLLTKDAAIELGSKPSRNPLVWLPSGPETPHVKARVRGDGFIL